MEQDHLEEISKENPGIDRTAIERSRQATRKLAEAGIKLGGFRLAPALGDALIKQSDTLARYGTSGTRERPLDQRIRER